MENKCISLIKKLYITVTSTPEGLSFFYSILLHVALVIGLVVIAEVLQTNKNTLNLAGGRTLVELNNQKIVQASTISSQSLENQISAYQSNQQKIYDEQRAKEQEHQQKIQEAKEQQMMQAQKAEIERQEALKVAEVAKQKALDDAKLKAEAQAKKVAEARKAEEQKQKALAEEKEKQNLAQQKQALEEAKRVAKQKASEEQNRKKEQAKQLAKQKLKKEAAEAKEPAAKANDEKLAAARKAALDALRQSALNDFNAQRTEASAQSATEKALQIYASTYKARIEAVWIMDDCRKISADHLPTVMVLPGYAPRISISSGSSQCDRSLLLAFKNAQAPALPQDVGARELITQGIDFKFGQQG